MQGPSTAEETLDYAPPEVLLGDVPFDTVLPESYDSWSIGVVILEIWLGLPPREIFALTPREETSIRRQLLVKMRSSTVPAQLLERAITLQSFAKLCITPDAALQSCGLNATSGNAVSIRVLILSRS